MKVIKETHAYPKPFHLLYIVCSCNGKNLSFIFTVLSVAVNFSYNFYHVTIT